jgi:hypothetical protein
LSAHAHRQVSIIVIQKINFGDKMNAYEEITNVVNKLFVFTDEQDWSSLKSEVFDRDVYFDMVSMGAEKAQKITAVEICEMWHAYTIASHYKNETTEGKIREFVGSYDIGLLETNRGWRINSFKYNLKYADGNIELK